MGVIGSIRFNRADLELFASASHDVNPLHLSESYTRRTPFGEPVVFGILGALAAFGLLPARQAMELASVSLSFRQPLFAGIDYIVEDSRSAPDSAKLSIRDAGRTLMTGTFRFREGNQEQEDPAAPSGFTPRKSSANDDVERLEEGVRVAGEYAVAAQPFRSLLAHWQLAGKGATNPQLAALLWSSYLIGMELPGERALFSQVKLQFASDSPPTSGSLF